MDRSTRSAINRLRGRAAIWAAALVLTWAGPARALESELLREHTLHYDVYRGQTELGEGRIILKNADSAGCYFYSQEAFPKSWLRWLSGDILEQSHFCVHDGIIRPVAFRYNRAGMGAANENFSLRFDWSKREVTYQSGQIKTLEEGMVDRLSMQLVLRDWILAEKRRSGTEPTEEKTVAFPDRKRLEHYRFQIKARERVKTPAGEFDTVRLDRIDNPKRRAQFWLATEYQYVVIKAEQQRNDDPVLRLLINKPPQPPPAP